MSKRFLLEGETDEKVYVGIAFNEAKVAIDLHTYAHNAENETALNAWLKGADAPASLEEYVRTVADENLLPETVLVKNVGKVRQIEIEWGNMLIQTRLLQSFDGELDLLKQRVASLNQFDSALFEECSDFWSRLLNFRKEHTISNTKLDYYKLELDVLFEAQKALRKDSRKEFDETSVANFTAFKSKLDAIGKDFEKNGNIKSILSKLKNIRSDFNKTPMRKSHKDEIDKMINGYFDNLSTERKEAQAGKVDKRVNDLEGIIEKMQKGIDWENRQLNRLKKDKEYAEQKFQIQLIDTKLKLVESNLAERQAKLKNITATYNKLKKES